MACGDDESLDGDGAGGSAGASAGGSSAGGSSAGGSAGSSGSSAGAAGQSGAVVCTPDETGPVPARSSTGVWEKIEIPGTVCSNGSQYKFWVNYSGTSNNVLVMFEPGGACWDWEGCSGRGGIRGAANPNGLDDDHMITWNLAYPAFDRGHPMNPTADWNYVFIPYCTADVHTGNNVITYVNPNDSTDELEFHHAGHTNMLAVVDWLDQTFTDIPRMMAAGCSAGGAGSVVNYHWLRSGLTGTQCGYLAADAGPIFPSSGPSGPLHQKIRSSWNVDPVLDKLEPEFGQEVVAQLKADFGSINTLLAENYPQDRLAAIYFRLDLNYSLYSYETFYDFPPASEIHDLWWQDTQALTSLFDQYDNLAYYIPYYRSDNCSHCASILPIDHIGEILSGGDQYLGTEIQEAGVNLRDFYIHLLDNETPLMSYLESEQPGEGFSPAEANSCL